MYKQASKMKLRIPTTKGNLSVEQMWSLSLEELDTVAIELNNKLETKSESFLTVKNDEDKITKLQFDIVLDILSTKIEENDRQKKSAENKIHNQKIYEKLAKRQDEKFDDMTEEELISQLKPE